MPVPHHRTTTIQNQQEGRLCGDCMQPIAVGEWVARRTSDGRCYHATCNPQKILFGDQLQKAVATPAPRRARKKGV